MQENFDSKSAIQRLTALWAFCECGIGGVMHLMKLPFTGLILGGLACIIVVLIARLSDNLQNDLLKSLMIVCLIKLSVSPHSPFTAYIAVGFQGFLGIFIYKWLGIRFASVFFVSVVSMLESALQKLLVLTIIYGNPLWEAVDSFGASVLKNFNISQDYSASNLIIGAYLFLYTLAGIFIALISNHILNILDKPETVRLYENIPQKLIYTKDGINPKKPFHQKYLIVIATIIIISVMLYSGSEIWKNAFYLLLRSFFILFFLYKIISPAILYILRNWLLKKQSSAQLNLNLTTDLFPHVKSVTLFAKQQSLKAKGLKRIKVFFEVLMLGVIFYKT